MDNIKSEAIINELLRTKNITQKQYSVLSRKIRNVNNMINGFYIKN